MLGREDRELVLALDVLAGEQVDDVDRFDRIAEELDAVNQLFVDGDELEHVAAHAERAAHEVEIVAAVLHVDQLAQQRVAVHLLAERDLGRHFDVVGGRAQAVDARDRRDDQGIGARQQRLRRRMAQALDLVVDRAVFLDVRVGRRDVRFGLIVVEVRNEILDRVVWKELAELGAELGGERLVVAQHQRRLLHELDHARHRHRFAASGNAQERLNAVAAQDAFGQRLRRSGLVARQRKGGDEFEFAGHRAILRPRFAFLGFDGEGTG